MTVSDAIALTRNAVDRSDASVCVTSWVCLCTYVNFFLFLFARGVSSLISCLVRNVIFLLTREWFICIAFSFICIFASCT